MWPQRRAAQKAGAIGAEIHEGFLYGRGALDDKYRVVALLHAVEGLLAGRPSGSYNLGTGEGHSNREILDAIARVVGKPVPHVEGGRRPGDPAELVADSSRFQHDFGWSPRCSDLDTIISSAWRWHQSQWT